MIYSSVCQSLSLSKSKEPAQTKTDLFDETMVVVAVNCVIEIFIFRLKQYRGWGGENCVMYNGSNAFSVRKQVLGYVLHNSDQDCQGSKPVWWELNRAVCFALAT